MINVLLVEDNNDLRELISAELKRVGYKVREASDGEKAKALFDDDKFDLIITDIMMPNVDGLELANYIRERDVSVPILIITAKGSKEDKYKGFNAGTDDYMVKPIDIDELLLRSNALLRRARILRDKKLVIGGATLYYDASTIEIDGESMVLPPKEFQILYKLLSYPNKIFTKNQLMEDLWDYDSETLDMTIYTHIYRLREKFINCPYFEIVTIRNLGYRAVVK